MDEGYNPSYGARPLRRAIMRLLEDSMAERMLAGDIKEGDSVIIDVDADGQVNVLNGEKKLVSEVSSTPCGHRISLACLAACLHPCAGKTVAAAATSLYLQLPHPVQPQAEGAPCRALYASVAS